MIYTIGNCKNYDKHLTNNNLSKAKGGTVWKKFSDVLDYFKTSKVYIDDEEVESAIYVVDANWEEDVIRKNNNQGELNKPCKIIEKINKLETMDKFSKMKPKNEFEEGKEKVLYSDEAIKVIDFEDWSIIKERDLVVCIPYLIEKNEFILRYEYIPTYKFVDGQEYHATVVGGQVETGEAIETAMLRELEEEAGIVVNEGYKLEPLKPLYIAKGMTSKFHPFIIPLNEREYSTIIPTGDGSDVEKKSKSVNISCKHIDSVKTSDLITDYLLLKLKEYMNLQK